MLTNPRDSHVLCTLGLAQLAQYDNSPNSDRSNEARSDACLSFQASIELEEKPLSGDPPEQLSSEFPSSGQNELMIAFTLTLFSLLRTNVVAGPAGG